MLLKYIPLIGCPFSFGGKVLAKALYELFILWCISSAPILFSLASGLLNGKNFEQALTDSVNIKIVFVYTTGFLAPVVFLLIDRLVYPKTQKVFSGAGLIFLLTILILMFSAWAYENDKFQSKDTWLELSYWLYGLSIYFWFLAIADCRNDSLDFEGQATKAEEDFTAKANKRRSAQ